MKKKRILVFVLSVLMLRGGLVWAAPGNGVKWIEYQAADPAGRYTAGTYFGRTGYLDTATGLYWATGAQDRKSWSNASNYCSGLGQSWRLPTIREMMSLYSASKSSTPLTNLPDMSGNTYWSATRSEINSLYAWKISFYQVAIFAYRKTDLEAVVCIHE